MKVRVCSWWDAGSGEYHGFCRAGERFPVPTGNPNAEGVYSAIYRTHIVEVDDEGIEIH